MSAEPELRDRLIDAIIGAPYSDGDTARRAVEHARGFCTGVYRDATRTADAILTLLPSPEPHEGK